MIGASHVCILSDPSHPRRRTYRGDLVVIHYDFSENSQPWCSFQNLSVSLSLECFARLGSPFVHSHKIPKIIFGRKIELHHSGTTPASKNLVPHSLSISTSSSSTSAQLLSLPFFPSCSSDPQPSLPLLPRLLLPLVNFLNPLPYTLRTPSPHVLVPLSKHRKVASLVHGDGVSAELPVLICLAFGGRGMAAERVLDFVAVAHCDGIESE